MMVFVEVCCSEFKNFGTVEELWCVLKNYGLLKAVGDYWRNLVLVLVLNVGNS